MVKSKRPFMMKSFMVFMTLLIIAGIGDIAYAKSGKIVGKVVDEANGEPLIGATVQINDTNLGAAADIDGNFIINRVPEGTYTVTVYSLGYIKTEIDGVTIEPDGSFELNVSLQSSVQETDTKITVTATMLQNTEATLLKSRAKAPTISDAISAQVVSQAGAGDAAAAVERVTGASISSGKVFIRGLGGRYGNSRLNGALIPTPDPEGNSVQMDLFQTNLLDNITVEKTFTPDKAGNFSGGSVDMKTKDLPEDLTLSFSSAVKYNSLATFNNNFLSASRSGTDWLGFDDGLRDVPEVVDQYGQSENPFPRYNAVSDDPGQAEELSELSRSFNKTSMNPIKRRAPLNQSYSFSFGNSYVAFGRPMGVLASLSYGTDYKYYDDGVIGRYGALTSSSNLDYDYLLRDTKGTESVSWGGLLSANYSVHQNHKFSTRYLYTREGKQTARSIIGEVKEDTRDLSDRQLFQTRSITYAEQEVRSFQLNGEHFLKPFKIDWQGAITNSGRDEPDGRSFSNVIRVDALDGVNEYTDTIQYDAPWTAASGYDGGIDTVLGVRSYGMESGTGTPSRFYQKITEDNIEGQVDIEFPIMKLNGDDLKIKTGFGYLEKSRDVRERYFVFLNSSTLPLDWDGDPNYFTSEEYMGLIEDIDSTIHTEVIFGWYYYDWNNDGTIDDSLQYDIYTGSVDTVGIDTSITYDIVFGAYAEEKNRGNSNRNNFVGEQVVRAAYAMTDLKVLSNLRFVGGVRREITEMSLESDFVESENLMYEDDWLPSASFTYSVLDEMNLRLAYGKTLARPTIREISPMYTREHEKGQIVQGNPELDRTLIDNYDFRWEWFPNPGEVLAASVFYKNIKNPIEKYFDSTTQNNEIKFQNSDKATVLGAEFEFRKNLGVFGDFLNNFSIEGNLALIKSEVKIDNAELNARRLIDSTVSDTRPFQDQSDYILNLNLNYDNYRTGTDITLLYNVFGERLTEVSNGFPDVFEQPRPDLDINASQRIMGNLKMKFSAKNLLGSNVEKVIHFKGEDYIFAKYSRGTTFAIGLSYSL